MADVFLSYARDDRERAAVVADWLRAAGARVWSDADLRLGEDWDLAVDREIAAARSVLLLWSEHSRSKRWLLREAELARRENKLVVARLDATPLPPELARSHAFDLVGWSGNAEDPRLPRLLAALAGASSPPRMAEPTDRPKPPKAERPDFETTGFAAPPPAVPYSDPMAAPEPVPSGQPTTKEAPAAGRRPGIIGRIVDGLGAWRKRRAAPPAPAPAAEAVWLAASAPRRCTPGVAFTAALVAYVEAARAAALQHLEDLGEPGDRRVQDIAASGWRVGAPVTVRLAGDGVRVTPAEIGFDWNGRENLAAFSVTVDAAARADAVVLGFEVLVAGVAVAYLPMRVAVGDAAGEAPRQVQGAVPRSAFASYASSDADTVSQRLSTLARWAPGLDIFQDCLDLKTDDAFKPQLEAQIAARDVFLLFWSRRAAASTWVRWEYTTARDRKGLDAILPMPLEDPAIAPPPPELSERHWRDRFLLAGYALARIRDEAARAGPT